MPSFKIKIDLPSRDELLAGLTADELYPALALAKVKVVGGLERERDDLRRELARLEGELLALPQRIRDGVAAASALSNTLVMRDNGALRLQHLARLIDEALARVTVEERAARAAVEREVYRRAEKLQRAVDELVPALELFRALDLALGRTIDPAALGGAIRWPCDNVDGMGRAHTVNTAVEMAKARIA
jgi:hypothetical protein